MAVPVARVHLKMAHGALPALLPSPPNWKMMLHLLPTACVVAAIPPKPPLAKPGRADANERWDARKIKPSSAGPSVSGFCSAESVVRSTAGYGSSHSQRKNTTSPPPKPGRADSVKRWDAHKKPAIPASSSASSAMSSLPSSSKSPISRASSAERWDVHKKRCPPRAEPLDDGESSSSGCNDIDTEEEEILWKPRAMYAGPGFAGAAPQPTMLPMPTAFLVPVA